MSPALRTLDDYRPEQPSKRDPTMETTNNTADELERLLQVDGFKTWGFVVYRCTYQSDSDWEKFVTLFLGRVMRKLKYYSGLDLLDDFAPTVFEDPSFEGATTAVLRDHFNQWAATAMHREQGVPPGVERYPRPGRYRFFVMVYQEALESVLNPPDPDDRGSSFIRLVNGEWEPEVLDEEELAEYTEPPPEFEPLEGCTLEDIGWMKVPYGEIEFYGFVNMCDSNHWDMYYGRPPEIQSL